jgi:hypothetical protein
MFLHFTAIIDEYYSADIAQRAKDSIIYRKSRGKTVGMPPFGTKRGEDGYLYASSEGAWLMPDGRFLAGIKEEQPHPDALWRGYFELAHHILKLYAKGNIGNVRLADQLNEEGWAFRTRGSEPRQVKRDDIRRVTANWAEYGGIVFDRKAKDRPAYEAYDVNALNFKPERSLFPIELLREVARVRHERSMKPPDAGENKNTRVYPLSVITYCAHCEELAEEKNDPGLRSTLTGRTEARGTRRYRHKSGKTCGGENLSVPCDLIEHDFGRLINLLAVSPDWIQSMADKLQYFDSDAQGSGTDLEQQKKEAIALARRRIDAAVHLYGDGMIDRDEYLRRLESQEREISHWETRTTETDRINLELAMCMEAIEKLKRLWEKSNNTDKQDIVRSLFQHIVYDLDTRQIVHFRLKPWADRFLVLRAALYDDPEDPDGNPGGKGTKKYPHSDDESEDTAMPHRGLYFTGCLRSRRNRLHTIHLVTRDMARSATPFFIVSLVQRSTQHNKAICPRLQPEIYYTLCV